MHSQGHDNRIPASTWGLALLGGLAVIAVVALSGAMQNYLVSEEFLVYSYASTLPHAEAWQTFFFEHGRLFETLYWTYQYKLIGFNPILARVFSFILILVASILASKCFLNVWPRPRRSPALPYLLTAVFFINWISMSSTLRISYDNGRLSLIFFFLAGLSLQRWAREGRGRWLAASYLLFFCSLLTYENAVFLFPGLLLLAWPLRPARSPQPARQQLLLWLGLSALSGMVMLLPHRLYQLITSIGMGQIAVPGLDAGLSEMASNWLASISSLYLQFGQTGLFAQPPLKALLALSQWLVVGLASVYLVGLWRQPSPPPDAAHRPRWLFIYLACLWFIAFGPLPYALLGYEGGGRVYSSAVFGLFPLLLMAYQLTPRAVLRYVLLAVWALHLYFGFVVLQAEARFFASGEAAQNTFYRGLKDAVPHVWSDTTFIFIDPPITLPGCAHSLEVLYRKRDFTCVIFSSQYDKYHTVRRELVIESSGERLNENNWILLNVEDNVPVLIDELQPGEYDLLITWESQLPIQTNYDKIIFDEVPGPSDFYKHLEERADVLFDE